MFSFFDYTITFFAAFNLVIKTIACEHSCMILRTNKYREMTSIIMYSNKV